MKAALFFIVLIFIIPLAEAEEAELFSAVLKNSAAYLEGRIPSKTRLVVFRVASDNSQRALTEYIEDYITASLVNAQKFTVVDRHNLEVIQQELDFQTRGDVDNRTAASIGKKAGAQTIVLGAYDGKFKRLTIRAIDVETASVRAIRSNMLIKEDAIFKALSGKHAGSKIGRPFERVIEDAASYLGSQVPSAMKTAVIIHTPEFKTRQTFRFIEFSADKLTEFLVNEHSFTVVERQNLDVLQKELNFQYSGEVNDKTAVSIGRRLGARCIALGTFKRMGEFYRLTIRAIDVETAAILGLENYIVKKDGTMNRLLSIGVDERKQKLLFAGARVGSALHFYKLNTELSYDIKAPLLFEAALGIDYRFSKYIGASAEFIFNYDDFTAATDFFSTGLTAYTISIPLFIKGSFSHGSFYFSSFAGPYIRLPSGKLKLNNDGVIAQYSFLPVPGAALGVEAGMFLGPGILVIDLRYSQDILAIEANNAKQYRAGSFAFSLGYKLGFLFAAY